MTDSDLPFVAELYASSRSEELAGLGWPEEIQRNFLEMQHQAQHRHFRLVYPNGEWLIVEQAGRPIGRLYLNETDESVHLVDFALVPECRGNGIGSAIVRDLIAHAHDRGKSVSCAVEFRNEGAARLYRRLGFEVAKDEGMYHRMICRPGTGEAR